MKNLRRSVLLLVVLVSALVVTNVFADVESVQGAVMDIEAPTSVALGVLESNTYIKVFEEVQDFALPKNLRVDKHRRGKKHKKGKRRIKAGTVVNSYMIHLDPEDKDKVRLRGCVRFDTKVLGLITRTKKLNNTDAMLGNPDTTYPNGVKARGMDRRDRIKIKKGNRVVCMNFRAGPWIDEVRVLTEPNEGSGGPYPGP